MRFAILTLCVTVLTACTEQKATGPTPTVTSVNKRDTRDENPRTMWAGAATPVTVTGERFVPMAGDTLLTKWFVEVPRLYLVNATSETELTDVTWLDRETMLAEIPSGIAIGEKPGWEDFQIVAVDPAGQRGPAGGVFRVSNLKPPVVSGTAIGGDKPVARFCDTFTQSNTAFSLTVEGTDFAPGVTANYALALTAGAASPATMAVMAVAATGVTVLVPAGLEAGVYDLRLTNVDGQRVTFADAFTIEFYTCPPPDYAIHSVTPRFAYRGDNVMLQVDGERFARTPRLTLRKTGYAVNVSYESFITTTTVQGLLYADAARQVGWYSLEVTNPGDVTGVTLASAVLVLDQPVPKVDAVTPDSFALSSPNTLTIRGTNFPSNVTVSVYYQGATGPVFFAATTTAVYATAVTATIPLGTIGVDASGVRVLVLRVFKQTSFGPVWSDYSNIVITGSSGNTGPVTTATSRLATARTEFGLVGGRNPIGSRFLYAIGGRTWYTLPNTAPVLETIEIASIDAFGNLSSFYASPTTLGVKAYGLQVVEFGGWLYASGGSTPTGYSNLVKKAKILDPAGAPIVKSAEAIPGTLAAGSWIYQVAAVMNGSDTENPNGETLPSFEAAQDVAASGGVRLTWKAVPNAASYRIYRSKAVNSGEVVLLASGVVCCSYDDTGAAVPGTKKPNPPGSLSVWQTAGTLNTARANHSAVVARDVNGTPYLFVLGGKNGAGAVGSYEHSGALTAGGDVTFTETADTAMARFRASASVATKTAVSATYRSGRDWIALYSGCDGASNTPLTDARNAEVDVGGALINSTTDGNVSKAAGTGTVFTNDRLFQFGGSIGPNGCTNNINPTASIQAGLLDAVLSWTNPNANGGNNLLVPRADFGFTRFNAQVFLVGGVWNNGGTKEVTNTIEYLFY